MRFSNDISLAVIAESLPESERRDMLLEKFIEKIAAVE